MLNDKTRKLMPRSECSFWKKKARPKSHLFIRY